MRSRRRNDNERPFEIYASMRTQETDFRWENAKILFEKRIVSHTFPRNICVHAVERVKNIHSDVWKIITVLHKCRAHGPVNYNSIIFAYTFFTNGFEKVKSCVTNNNQRVVVYTCITCTYTLYTVSAVNVYGFVKKKIHIH